MNTDNPFFNRCTGKAFRNLFHGIPMQQGSIRSQQISRCGTLSSLIDGSKDRRTPTEMDELSFFFLTKGSDT